MLKTYRKRQALAADLGVSKRIVEEATKGLREHKDRYPDAVIQSGKLTLLDREAVLDWIRYRDALEVGSRVPAFNREAYQ